MHAYRMISAASAVIAAVLLAASAVSLGGCASSSDAAKALNPDPPGKMYADADGLLNRGKFEDAARKFEDLDRLTGQNLAFVQFCDVAGVPRELMSDSDRIFPGEGDFRLEAIVGRLRHLGYEGWISLELLNPVLWQGNANQVAELGWRALCRTLGT